MIEKSNITIENKDTKEIKYKLWLDDSGYWIKREFDSRGNQTYFEDSGGYWFKNEYNSRGKEIYYENSEGIIRDDR